MNFGKILVPLDGSNLAEAALWTALEIADGATISLLRAAEVDTLPILIVRPEGAPVDNLGGAVPAGAHFRV
jgi:hypothetical protein